MEEMKRLGLKQLELFETMTVPAETIDHVVKIIENSQKGGGCT
jgi:hypothetical protein